MISDAALFIREQTKILAPPLVPEINLHLATEVTPLWQLTEERLRGETGNAEPPYWAIAWPGGQGLARYILDHPETVRGKRVLDFAAGSGLGAIAALKAGAKKAIAADLDPLALEAIALNAQNNDVGIDIEGEVDLTKPYRGVDVIMAGDIFYQQAIATTVTRWLRLCANNGVLVLVGDPGRAYAPKEGLDELAQYNVPTSRDIEDRDSRQTTVWRMQANG